LLLYLELVLIKMASQKFTTLARTWHRDIAYFFVGLIISFSISGITLNHRRTFSSRTFSYDTEQIKLNLPSSVDQITEDFIQSILPVLDIGNKYEGFQIRNGSLRILFDKARAEVNLETGEGEKEWIGKKYVLAEMADLHQTTNPAWIWYSDIFGIAMILIAISGMFISGGNSSFKQRGWKLALVGIIFPLIFLFVLA